MATSGTGEAPGWTPLSITGRELLGPRGGRITLRFGLTERADGAWGLLFKRAAAARSGSTEFINGPDPAVPGEQIEWQVPEGDLENAWSVVKSALAYANEVFPQVLRERAEELAEMAQRFATESARHDELQRRLDALP